MEKYVRTPVDGDVDYVARHMRQADIEEVQAAGFDPLSALQDSVALSEVVYTLVDRDGNPCALLGVAKGFYGDSGAIWLLGTDSIEKHSMTFLRHSKAVLERLFEETGYGFFYNYTYTKNELHHRWLKWLGFSFLRKTTIGDDEKEFYEFAKLRG